MPSKPSDKTESSPSPPDIPLSTTFIPPSIATTSILSSRTYTYSSPLPSTITSSTPCMLGVDEAGRGPVLGPMVYAVSYIPTTSNSLLTDAKFDDSKKLTAAYRSHLLSRMCTPTDALYASVGWSATIMSPRDISAGMMRAAGTGAYNLNAQAHDTTAELIRGVIASGVNITEIYVDTVGVASSYQAKLQRLFPNAIVTVAKKADSLYPIVSAASVCAKVTRDVAIDVLVEAEEAAAAEAAEKAGEKAEKCEMGSGYPGDEKTKGWLKRNIDPVFGWDGRVTRFSWRTVRDMLEGKTAKGYEADWPEDDDGEQRITGFFGGGGGDQLAGWYGKPVGAEEF